VFFWGILAFWGLFLGKITADVLTENFKLGKPCRGFGVSVPRVGRAAADLAFKARELGRKPGHVGDAHRPIPKVFGTKGRFQQQGWGGTTSAIKRICNDASLKKNWTSGKTKRGAWGSGRNELKLVGMEARNGFQILIVEMEGDTHKPKNSIKKRARTEKKEEDSKTPLFGGRDRGYKQRVR